MLRRFLCAVGCFALLGCANNQNVYDANYQAYVAAQREVALARAGGTQVLKLEAKQGETITLGGVQSLVVTLPNLESGGMSGLQQRVDSPSEAYRWASLFMPVIGSLGSIWLGGEAAKGLVTATGATNSAIAANGFSSLTSVSSNSMQGFTNLGGQAIQGSTSLGLTGLEGVKSLGVSGLSEVSSVANTGLNRSRCVIVGGVFTCS